MEEVGRGGNGGMDRERSCSKHTCVLRALSLKRKYYIRGMYDNKKKSVFEKDCQRLAFV